MVISMKKKLVISMLLLLIFSVSIIAAIFVYQVNSQYRETLKHNLDTNNRLIISLLESQKSSTYSDENEILKNFKQTDIRITLIDKTGLVLYDSVADITKMDNHNNRPEIIDARQTGLGSSLRKSDTENQNMLYFATSFGDGYVIRSSLFVATIVGFEENFVKYYIFGVIFVILLSVFILTKLADFIVTPIKELEYISSRVASGELNRRVKITSKDEIGKLGKTFNYMANRLEMTINDAVDKQTRLQAILKSMDSGVIAVDSNLKVIMINPYAEKIFGINKSIIGKNLMDTIRNFELEDIFENSLEDYKEIKILWPKERELRIRTAEIINDNLKLGKVAVVQDITDIRKLENIRSQFVANVSHELKTPLTSIMGFSETLKDVEDSKTKEKFLNIINDEAQRLTRLINDILALSDIENNSEVVEEEINISDVLMDVCNLMKNIADNKKIHLECTILNEPTILFSKDRFKQMLINLIDNGIKYTDAGGVFVTLSQIGDNAIISVKDTGTGIPKDDISRLFERFYRVDKARSRAQGGTGLGLAIVKHIVLSLNGTIEVKSEIDKGSNFIIKFPVINK